MGRLGDSFRQVGSSEAWMGVGRGEKDGPGHPPRADWLVCEKGVGGRQGRVAAVRSTVGPKGLKPRPCTVGSTSRYCCWQ